MMRTNEKHKPHIIYEKFKSNEKDNIACYLI